MSGEAGTAGTAGTPERPAPPGVPPTEAARAALAGAADDLAGEAEAFLAALVGIPTFQPPGDLAEAAEAVAALLVARDLPVEQLPVPDPFVRQHGMASIVNLLVRVPFGSGRGPTVGLAAPLDTAPPGEGWTVDPLAAERRDGRLVGRGAAESKGDVAAYVFALEALRRAGEGAVALDGTVELHLTFDDETGGYVGPQFLLAQGLVRPDWAIAAGATRTIGIGQGGCLQMDVVLRGRQAHVARTLAGRDALESAMPVLSALYAERGRLAAAGPSWPGGLARSLAVTTIQGGNAANLVPERVVLRLDRRISPDEDADTVEEALVALVGEAASGLSGVEVECHRRLLAPPVRDLSLGSGLAALVADEAERALGSPVACVLSGVLSGARFYAEAGIPTVAYGAGPGGEAEGAGYGPDEAVALADLRTATGVVAACLARLLSA